MAFKEYEPGTTFPGVIGRTVESRSLPGRAAAGEGGTRRTCCSSCSTTSASASSAATAPRSRTPNLDRLAARGLRYTNFHTTALCSPTRAVPAHRAQPPLQRHGVHRRAGRRASRATTGASRSRTASCPRCCCRTATPRSRRQVAPHARASRSAPAGPYDRWPLGRGFERFYGFLGGETDQYYPDLVLRQPSRSSRRRRRRRATTSPRTWPTRRSSSSPTLKQVAPDKPFFLYFCPGADARAAPRAAGVDRQVPGPVRRRLGRVPRAGVRAPAGSSGIVAAGHRAVAARPRRASSGTTLSDDERRLYARMMEVFAGFLEHTDHQIGRLLDFLERARRARQHADHGRSPTTARAPRAGRRARSTRTQFFNNVPETLRGEPRGASTTSAARTYYNHYPWGWTWAGNTPFRRWKRETYRGGVDRSVHRALAQRASRPAGEIRDQYAHAIDMVPTVLDALGIEPPTAIRGVAQSPIEGVSFAHTFDDAQAPSRHRTQYFEMFGHRVDLPRRLARGLPVAGPVVRRGRAWRVRRSRSTRREARRARRQRLGALPPRRGPRRDQRPRRRAPRPADRDDRALVRRGRQVQRAADRQPRHWPRWSTSGRRSRQAARPLRLLPGHPVGARSSPRRGCSTGRTAIDRDVDDPRGRRGGRAVSPGRRRRRLLVLRQGRPAALRLQLRRPGPASRSPSDASPCRRAGTRCASSSSRPASPTSPTARACPGAASSTSTAARRRDASSRYTTPLAVQPRGAELRRRPGLAGHRRLHGAVPLHRHDAQVAVDLAGELISDDEGELRVAMARQ